MSMGVSTNAILFWGILLESDKQELDAPWDAEEYDGEWEEYYLNLHEVFYVAEEGPEKEIYWEKYRELITNASCGIGRHCSGDYPLRYAYVVNSRSIARRGHPEEILDLDVGDDWKADLKTFCKKMSLEWQEPKWWLVSYWG